MGSAAGVEVADGVPDPVVLVVLVLLEVLVPLPAVVLEPVPAPVVLPVPEAEEPAPLVPALLPVEPVPVVDPVLELPALLELVGDPAEEDVPEAPAVLPAAFAGMGEGGCTLPQPMEKSPKYRAGTNKNMESRCIVLPRRSYRLPAGKTELCAKLRQR